LALHRTERDRKGRIDSLEAVRQLGGLQGRRFHSAQHDEIRRGATTDIYFVKTQEILRHLGGRRHGGYGGGRGAAGRQ